MRHESPAGDLFNGTISLRNHTHHLAKHLDGARRSRRNRRRGATLLLALFTMSFTAIVLIGVLDSVRLQVSAQRSTVEYERANYVAGAGVHHALSLLEDDRSWRTGIPQTTFSAAGSGAWYSATVVDSTGDTVIVTGTGFAGGVTRTLKVTIE